MGKHSEGKNKNKALKIFLRILLILVVLIVILAGVAVGYISNKLGKLNVEEIDETAIGIDEDTKDRLSGFRNIALLGIDSRADDYGVGNRSDCIIIASLNEKTKEIKLISVYRDTYLQIEEKGKTVLDKVTHAYAYGGAQNTLKALNTNLDLNITEYVTVNFDAVIAAVDAIGGITINIEDEEELYQLNDYVKDTRNNSGVDSGFVSGTGRQVLNGVQAVAYSRVRYTAGGDYKRSERMRTVIEAMLEKAKTLSVGQLNNLIDTILPRISTNISGTEILGLVPSIASYDIVDSEGWPYKTEGVTLDKWYGVPVTLESNVLQLHQQVFGQTDYVVDDTVKEISQQIINKTGKK